MPAVAVSPSASSSRSTRFNGNSPPAARTQFSPQREKGGTDAFAKRPALRIDRSQGGSNPASSKASREKTEPKILHQSYFKSIGPRTYAAQVKQAGNGNHFLVLTEGKRDDKSNELRKTRLFIFSEDFPAFFRMLHETAQFIRANPVPQDIKQRQAKFWAKRNTSADSDAVKK